MGRRLRNCEGFGLCGISLMKGPYEVFIDRKHIYLCIYIYIICSRTSDFWFSTDSDIYLYISFHFGNFCGLFFQAPFVLPVPTTSRARGLGPLRVRLVLGRPLRRQRLRRAGPLAPASWPGCGVSWSHFLSWWTLNFLERPNFSGK